MEYLSVKRQVTCRKKQLHLPKVFHINLGVPKTKDEISKIVKLVSVLQNSSRWVGAAVASSKSAYCL
jgi:hypothetical protein